LIVAVHDVTPAHQERLRRVYALLEDLAIRAYALLVVPDWHGQWPLEQHAAFVDDLLRRQASGVEILLHGYRHDEAGFPRSLLQRARIAGRTAASAEFRVVPPEEAERRLDRGLEMFGRLGLRAVGFVPPAWLQNAGGVGPLSRRGLEVTESYLWIQRTRDRRRLFAPALSWSTARPWRSRLSAGVAGIRPRLEHGRRLLRVAIHPPDVEVPVVAASVRAALAALVARTRLTSYCSLVGT
jgi:predicted deacetylase